MNTPVSTAVRETILAMLGVRKGKCRGGVASTTSMSRRGWIQWKVDFYNTRQRWSTHHSHHFSLHISPCLSLHISQFLSPHITISLPTFHHFSLHISPFLSPNFTISLPQISPFLSPRFTISLSIFRLILLPYNTIVPYIK